MISVYVIRDLIAGLDLSSSVISYTNDSVQTELFVSNVYHARRGLVVLVNGQPYPVYSVNYELNSLVIRAVIELPTVLQVPTPFFFHGTFTKTNNELNEVLDLGDKVPMAYLHETMLEELAPVTSGIDTIAEVKLFLMDKAPENGATTAQQYTDVITPLTNLAEAIRQALYDSPKFGEIGTIRKKNEIEWGTYQDSKGHMKRFFDAQLSGIGLFFDLPILKCCN